LKSTLWIKKWICWKPGSDDSIELGKDRILGLGPTPHLSLPLIMQLNSLNIHFLYQATHNHEQGIPTIGWKTGHDLELSADLAVEWDNFCLELTRVGVLLHNAEDQFLWAGRDSSGHISVKNIYMAIANTTIHNNRNGWCKKLWIWKIPLKIKLFNWLADESKIPTWDNLLRKGWMGPNICQLCYREAKTVQHLFIQCHFTR
jgi:hypothetical protein